MKLYAIYFSPTGGTKRVAELLCSAWGAFRTIDLCEASADFSSIKLGPDDVCVAAAPSYAGRIPELAAKRFAELCGNGAKAIAAAVYGNREFEDTLIELADVLKSAGFRVMAGVSAIAEHSMVREIASGRPDESDAAELRDFSARLKRELESDAAREPEIPGNRPYKSGKYANMGIKAGRNCTKCGACARLCPAGAIPADEPSKTDGERCISCMRCVGVCPEHARAANAILLMGAEMKLKKVCAVRKENKLYV